jgi:hypothetical protein
MGIAGCGPKFKHEKPKIWRAVATVILVRSSGRIWTLLLRRSRTLLRGGE